MLVLFLITALQASQETGDFTVPALTDSDADMQTFEPQVCALWDAMGSARRSAEVGAQIAIFTQGWVGGRNCNKKGYLGDDFVHAAIMTHNPNTKLMTLDYFSSQHKRNMQVILPERDLKKITAEKTNFKTFKTYKEIRYQFTVGIEHSSSNRASSITFMKANYRTKAHMEAVCKKHHDQTCKNNPPGVGKDGGFRCFCNNGYRCVTSSWSDGENTNLCTTTAGYAPYQDDALARCVAPGNGNDGASDVYKFTGQTSTTVSFSASMTVPKYICTNTAGLPFNQKCITVTETKADTALTAALVYKMFADAVLVNGDILPTQATHSNHQALS